MKAATVITCIVMCTLNGTAQKLLTSGFNPLYSESSLDGSFVVSSAGEIAIFSNAYLNEGLLQNFVDVEEFTLDENENVRVWPNPFRNSFSLVQRSSTSKLKLFDASGRLVFSTKVDGEFHEIDTTALAKGIYFLKLFYEEYCSTTLKIIKS